MKIRIAFFLLGAIALLSSCQSSSSTNATAIKKGMIKVTILYPNNVGMTFDMDYYANKHMPMVAGLFGEALQGYAIDKGMAGRTPSEPIPYLAVGYFYFNTLAEYEKAFGPNAQQILGDIPNYTNIQPVLQISEVVH